MVMALASVSLAHVCGCGCLCARACVFACTCVLACGEASVCMSLPGTAMCLYGHEPEPAKLKSSWVVIMYRASHACDSCSHC